MKFEHEFRDPIHAFVRMDTYERRVVDSTPYQRLRHIHQLALTYLVYPGATHRRFEHCLGVMELASKVFDTVTRPDKLRESAALVEPLTDPRTTGYWRNVVRMAALCHDLGHLPFSHAGEGLLLEGESHETITRRIIESAELAELMLAADPPIRAPDVADLATKTKSLEPWKQILAEIIQSDFFGVDRIDYLLRDSHHAGVGYGRFDHYRLLDTVRVLPPPPADTSEGVEATPALGVERGGVQSAEQLLLARHYMFSGLYLHPIRRVYDVHLADFLRAWLPGGVFSTDPDELLRMHDNRVLAAIEEAAGDPDAPGHDPARRIVKREHFRLLYEPSRADHRINLDAGAAIAEAAIEQFGSESVRHSTYPPKDASVDFPVLLRGRVVPASSMIDVLTEVPPTRFDGVFVSPEKIEAADRWLEDHKDSELESRQVEEEDEG